MKTANSIVREAVPGGLFKGKSKQLYDTLYLLTRGAVTPSRKVRISRHKLMAKAHIGARVTFDTNIRHLESVGLIIVRHIAGEHDGNEYEIFLPEEAPTMTSQTSLTSQTSHAQKLVRLVSLESSQTRHTSSSIESTISTEPKTFSKDCPKKNDDDEPAALLLRALQDAEREVAGKTGDPTRWFDVLNIIVAELKVAASRSPVVSSAPAFLAEHLRRRLGKAERQSSGQQNHQVTSEAPTPGGKREFTDEPCSACKGSLMEIMPSGEKKRCGHCRDEVNYPTGREPKDG
jgi:hypothetical protein